MSTGGYDTDEETTTESPAELRTQIEILTEENEQLRASYTQAKQTQYQRTAVGFAVLGLLAVGGGVVLGTAQSVLFALGGTGLFAAVLTYYLTPEQFVSADVGHAIFSALATNEANLSTELGLTDDRFYLPTGDTTPDVRLFIPQAQLDRLPESTELEHTLVATDDGHKGLSLVPSGSHLFDEFSKARTGTSTDDPATLATQLTDAVVEQFELVQTADPEIDLETNRLTVSLSGSAYGTLDTFDHPVPSFLAVGLAAELNRPVTCSVRTTSDDDPLVTLRWTAANAPSDEPPDSLD